ncbi:MAG: RNA 2',3'-cyclic phosphodiesterase [Candidatus Omnitrophota bacterium]
MDTIMVRPNSPLIRAFIAVELEPQIKEELAKIQEVLKTSQADVKWVEPVNLHITLKFLGQTPIEKIEKINQLLKDSLSHFSPFPLSLKTLGAFPKINYPRVIWVGAFSPENKLNTLADLVEGKLVSLKFPKEKRDFQSHITLGRVRSTKNQARLIELIQGTQVQEKTMMVASLTFFKSHLSAKGSIYQPIFKINLGR